MRRAAIFSSLILICLTAAVTAFGQKGCEFSIVGTWKGEGTDEANTLLYRFAPDGTVTVLSRSGSDQGSELREIASATYKLDNPDAPRSIAFKGSKNTGLLVQGTTSMQVIAYDEGSFTCVRPGSSPTRWVRVEPYRYFIILAGRSGTFYDGSGPTFSILIKAHGTQIQVEASGVYSIRDTPAFGPVPAETYNEFMKEPRNASDVMLRLEITSTQYERSLKILRTWNRRVREGALLYPDISMDNILLVKQITESLNQCSEKIKLYNLDWGLEDNISEANGPTSIPFQYFKELRRLNESLHVRDDKFSQASRLDWLLTGRQKASP